LAPLSVKEMTRENKSNREEKVAQGKRKKKSNHGFETWNGPN